MRTSFARTLAEALYAAPPEETHNVLEAQLQAFCGEFRIHACMFYLLRILEDLRGVDAYSSLLV